MRIEDISPTGKNTTLKDPNFQQSTGGRGLTIAGSPDGRRLYIGNNAGVWRSKDGGLTWTHLERPQPRPGSAAVPGALLSLNVYDLAVAKDPDVVLACTNYDIRKTKQDGIWRSTDGGANWKLVQPFAVTGQIVAAPENAAVLFAAGGNALVRSDDSGATWKKLTILLGAASVFHVTVGPAAAAGESTRRIYALGNGGVLWTSPDGGGTWAVDSTSPLTGFAPGDAVGRSTRLLAIHPANPKIVYGIVLAAAGKVRAARGDFSGATPVWTFVTDPPFPGPAHTTDSGTEHLAAHVTREGHLYLFVSTRSAHYVSNGDSPAVWTRLDTVDFGATGAAIGLMHIDPHAVYVSKDFRLASDGGGRGLIAQVNDGGVQISTNGTTSWTRTNGYTTFSLINVAVNPVGGAPPAITFGTGDNGGFFSADGGANWISAEYQQGDNDASFSDPRQPSLLFVFAPRKKSLDVVLYTGAGGKAPNAGFGTSQFRYCPAPTRNPVPGGDPTPGWNCVSDSTTIGYRPLILTLPGESPKPGGDFVTIRIPGGTAPRRLMRTTKLGSVMAATDWDSTTTSEAGGASVFQQGPALPPGDIRILQASGGHANPTYYIGDRNQLWKWTSGMANWQALVPATSGPPKALRFHVDPYRPRRLYVLDDEKVWRSGDGGSSWTHDTNLEAALTEGGAMPKLPPSVNNTVGRTPFEAQLQDFAFDPNDEKVMFAAGPAGVFMTSDGVKWSVLASAASLNTRFMSLFLDIVSDPTTRILYAATPFRGLLKITLTPGGVTGAVGLGVNMAKALLFKVFRTAPFPDPFVASVDPVNPDVTKPEGKLQKALTDAIKAKASEAAHNQILKARDPAAADLATIFPIPFTIAEVTTAGAKFPVAHYNGDEVDFIASAAKVIVLFAAIELRTMVRRFAQDVGITRASELLATLPVLNPQIQGAVQLIKAGKDVLGRRVPIKDAQRVPDYARIFDFDETGGTLTVNFKGVVGPESDPKKKTRDYDFGHSLYNMIVSSGDEPARNCIESIGYAFINGALEAAGFFERPPSPDPTTPPDPKTFRGLWIGGNFAFETIRGEMSVNDGPAQLGGTTRQLAKLIALIRAGTFQDVNDPVGDLSWFLLNNAADAGARFPPIFQTLSAGVFKYVLNKLGWAQLGRGDPSANFVASEVSLIKTEKVGRPDRLYVVAWLNVELRKSGAVVERGGRKLYALSEVFEIIKATLAAYEA